MKPGRRRKHGDRKPSGDLRDVQPHDVAPVKLRRLADAAMARIVDPMFGSPIGLMHAAREISDSEFAAVQEYVKRHQAWHRQIDAQSPTARSASLMPGYGAQKVTDEGDAKAQARAKRRYEEARMAVRSLRCGIVILNTLDRICIEEHAPSWAEKRWIKPALEVLVVLFKQGRRAA